MTKIEQEQERAAFALFKAAARWAESFDGSVVVSGPISIMRWPGDRKMKYTIAISCVGAVPTSTPRRRSRDHNQRSGGGAENDDPREDRASSLRVRNGLH